MAWSSLIQVATPLSYVTNVDTLIAQDRFTYNYELPLEDSIDYTFDVSSNVAAPSSITLKTMTESQKTGVRTALSYITEVTGIPFTERDGRTSSDIVFAYYSTKPGNAGVDYSDYKEELDDSGRVAKLTIYDTIMLNSNNPEQVDTAPGTDGYATVLHKVGHALGLKHPFEGSPTLTTGFDNESFTIMSYTPSPTGGHPTTYGPIDLAALDWLYGGDGLRGAYGLTVNIQGEPVTVVPTDFGDPLGGMVAYNTPQATTLTSTASSAQQTNWFRAASTSGAELFAHIGDSLLASPGSSMGTADNSLSSWSGAGLAATDILQKNQPGSLVNS
ncbi:MAG: hypothetical protein HY915_02345 [Desulfovibrio sp.]|nr:hypothetical protein [Desulfovibrio sp.]